MCFLFLRFRSVFMKKMKMSGIKTFIKPVSFGW